MNKKQLRKLAGRHLQVFPPVIGSSATTWFANIEPDGRLKLSASTGFFFHPTSDNMHEFRNDPTNPQGGIICLKGWLAIQGYNMAFTPFSARPAQSTRKRPRERRARHRS